MKESDGENSDRQKFNQSLAKESKESTATEDKFKIFEKWLIDNGTTYPKLELRDYGNEVRGCHSKEQIYDDEIIIRVPLNCLITVEMGRETAIGKAIIASNIDLDAPKHIFLMLYMLVDMKNTNSFFKPYYDILPQKLDNMPIFWTQEELKYLEGSYLREQIDERNSAIEADYKAICKICPEFVDFATLHEFKWARMCVCSRNFGLVINGTQTAALVPYADMLNHYRPRETKWQFDDPLQSFTVVSLQNIPYGAQVYDSYGRKCNHRFLLNYGFSVENNIESDGFCPNEVPILLELNKTDPLFESKCSFWRRDLAVPSRRIRVCVGDNENAKMMLAFLRVIEADKYDFDLLASCSGSNSYRSIRDAQVAVSVRNEQRAMMSLVCLCDQHLSDYPTSYEADCQRLQHGNIAPFSNERHALIQVKGEKEVLLFYKDFGITAVKLLQARDIHELDVLMEQVRVTKHPIMYHYCRDTVSRLKQDELRRQEIRRKNFDLSKPTVV